MSFLKKLFKGNNEEVQKEKIVPLTNGELVNISQTPVKQRKVSKIIVLFDDGTYQEL